MLAKLELPATIELLSQLGIWICDTGASCHSTYSPVGATNIRNSGISTVGHVGQAVATTKTIDIPGRFVSRDGTRSMDGVLTEVGLNPKMNYNLMSLSRTLMKGWRILPKGIRLASPSLIVKATSLILTLLSRLLEELFLRSGSFVIQN